MNSSLFCEWVYVLNSDAEVLEVYRGLQHARGDGRYAEDAKEPNKGGYWPVSLIAEIPFSADGVAVTWQHVVDFGLEENAGAKELKDVVETFK